MIEHHGPGDHAAGIPAEIFQQRELLLGELQLDPAAARFPANQVQFQVGNAQAGGLRLVGCTAAEQGPEAGQQFGDGVCREQIGAIFFVSVTGLSSPSVDARLVNRMGLPRNVKRNPIFGLGCVAGAAGLARAADYVRAYPDQVALLLSIELCSLTFQRDDVSAANLISAGLFGDGAAAVLVAGSNVQSTGPKIIASHQAFYPDTQDVMGWKVSEKGFQIVLSPDVPKVVRENLGNDVDTFLAAHSLTRKDIGTWIMHTGGPKVLEASAEALGLPDSALEVSWDALRRVGNLSSASVLVVLDEVMRNRRPEPGTKSILAAMGPGFCAEILLLEW